MPAPDLRLLGPAASAWVAAWVLVRLAAVPAAGAGAALLGAALLVLLVPARTSGRWLGARGALALAVGVGAAVLLAGAVQQHVRTAGAFGAAVAGHRTATLDGRLTGPPRQVTGGCRYSLDVQVVEIAGEVTRAAAPVDVLAACAPLGTGSTVRTIGTLSEAGAPGRAVAVLRPSQPPQLLRGPSGLDALAARVRETAGAAASAVPGEPGALLPAIAWGDVSRLPDGLVEAMRTAGLTHVTAVSGAHFALIASLVLVVGASLGLPRAPRAGLTLVVATGLVVLVGPQPSVLRAAVMGAVSVAGLLLGRPAAGPAALSTAVIGLLLADPWLAVDLGFVLSVAATAGIVLVVPTLVARWSPVVGRPVATVLGVPLVAQLACGPFLLAFSPTVATWSVLANLAVAPAIGPATVLGLAGAVLSPVWPDGAAVLLACAGAACWWVVTVAHLVSAAPGAGLAWWPGLVGGVLLAGAGIGLLGLLLRTAPDPRGTLGGCQDLVDPPAVSSRPP